MDAPFYQQLADDALADRPLDDDVAQRLLTDPDIELLPLLNAAYTVRKAAFGKAVQVHVLNNAQNGRCPEDCAYCTQARTSEADIEAYPIKSDEEVLAEAKRAYEAGAYRYCMVFAGRGPNWRRTRTLARLVAKIKASHPLEVCVSAGLLDEAKARVLAEAGLDRLNHNLNTSRANYPRICSTHTYDDRLGTLRAARSAGLQTCSGLIVGMGETTGELIEIAHTLRELGSESIPVNFLLPFEGNVLREAKSEAFAAGRDAALGDESQAPDSEAEHPQNAALTPAYCLRVLCLFRLMLPRAEVRCAAGREFHLRSMEVMSLYAANSLFLGGYLNSRGADRRRTYQMIRDAGFVIDSDVPMEDEDAAHMDDAGGDDLEGRPPSSESEKAAAIDLTIGGQASAPLKTLAELRPRRPQ